MGLALATPSGPAIIDSQVAVETDARELQVTGERRDQPRLEQDLDRPRRATARATRSPAATTSLNSPSARTGCPENAQ